MENNSRSFEALRAFFAVLFVIAAIIGGAFCVRWYNLSVYGHGLELYYEKNYDDAKQEFLKVKNFKHADSYINLIDCKTIISGGKTYLRTGDYELAFAALNNVDKILVEEGIKEEDDLKLKKSFEEVKNELLEFKYQLAKAYFENESYEVAIDLFKELGDYEDSILYLAQIDVRTIDDKKEQLYEAGTKKYENGEYIDSYNAFMSIGDYKDSALLAHKSELKIRQRNLNTLISCGLRNSVAVDDNGKVLYSNKSIIGLEEALDWDGVVSVDTYGTLIIGLLKDNSVRVAGTYDGNTISSEDWTDVIDVASGEQFVAVLHSDGSVEARGHDGDGQCETRNWENIVDIDAGWRFAVGLSNDGKLVFSGISEEQEREYENEKEKWSDVIKISASGGGESAVKGRIKGRGHTVGLKSDGTVVAVGDNRYGQCDVEEWTDIVRIATGDWYTVGLKEDGSILVTGENTPGCEYIDYAVIDSLEGIIDIAAGYGQTMCLLDSGEIVAFGFNDDNKTKSVFDWSNSSSKEVVIKEAQWLDKKTE